MVKYRYSELTRLNGQTKNIKYEAKRLVGADVTKAITPQKTKVCWYNSKCEDTYYSNKFCSSIRGSWRWDILNERLRQTFFLQKYIFKCFLLTFHL